MNKIGIDATALVERPTGVGNYVSRLLEPLCRMHARTTFVLFSNDSICFPDLPNVVKRVSTPKRRGPFWQNTQLRAMLAADQPDVFWGTNGLLPLWRPSGMATVLTVHDLVYRFAPETLPLHTLWGRRLTQSLAVRSADRIVVVSHATARDAAAVYGRTPDAIITPLVDPGFRRASAELVSDVRARLALPPRYLLTLSTLEPRKNMVRLVDAYLARRTAGIDLPVLVIAGGKGWLDNDLEARLAHGESLGHLKRLGYVPVEDLPALFGACDAFLMPSLYEGFGMPLLEAQLCGAAVIHGPHASMHEAAGELGVETPIDRAGLEAMLDGYAAGRLPLACRLPTDIVNDAQASAARLWALFVDAAARKQGDVR